MRDEMITGADIRAFRERHGLYQEGLAAFLGVSLNTVSRWELGTRRIQSPEMLRLALAHLDATSRPADCVICGHQQSSLVAERCHRCGDVCGECWDSHEHVR